jgi:HEPN domain-containing protein
MNDRTTKLSKNWLKKAKNDLITARQTLLLPDGPTDTVCFHSQQAIEKAIKSLLVYNEITFPRTHDLNKLFDLVKPLLPQIEDLKEKITEISSFAVDIRYPGEWSEPIREETIGYFKIAEKVYLIISEKLPDLLLNI